MSDRHSEPPEDRFFCLEKQEVTISDFESSGFILDIGGGGEGIVGILKGEKVVAIDLCREELEEAPEGPLKVIMDARDLQFLDGSFNTVTSFFALMYIKNRPDYERVFSEVFRVLKPGGQFLIWEVSVPQRIEGKGDIYLIPVLVRVKDKEIDTAYGQPRPNEKHDPAFYVDLAARSGFIIDGKSLNSQTFYLRLRKPWNAADGNTPHETAAGQDKPPAAC